MNNQEQCDLCSRQMQFVEIVPRDIEWSGDQITAKLESSLWECREHGLWRIYISGKRERVRRRESAQSSDGVQP